MRQGSNGRSAAPFPAFSESLLALLDTFEEVALLPVLLDDQLGRGDVDAQFFGGLVYGHLVNLHQLHQSLSFLSRLQTYP